MGYSFISFLLYHSLCERLTYISGLTKFHISQNKNETFNDVQRQICHNQAEFPFSPELEEGAPEFLPRDRARAFHQQLFMCMWMAELRTWYKSTLNMNESTIKEAKKHGRVCVTANTKKGVVWCSGQLKTTIGAPLLLI